MKAIHLAVLLVTCIACQKVNHEQQVQNITPITEPSLVILGTVQDGGSPHIGCEKACCQTLFNNPAIDRRFVSLGLVDPKNNKSFLFEATPDITEQMMSLSDLSTKQVPDGIFLTHAHIGHYTGLMYLGKEAMNAQSTPVYAMPRMKTFLETNGPWSQLVSNQNIDIRPIEHQQTITLTPNLRVTPFTVPHRDEYSETVGYTIAGPNKKVLFIPDIDKWEKWDQSIIEAISKVDYAFVDATFYDAEEINNRDISEIPHPFIIESMALFNDIPKDEKRKIYFIHFNHTNPALNPESEQSKFIESHGFNIARIGRVIKL